MANAVLFLWPFIAIALFGWLGRERGLIWSVVVGYLFLPEAITVEIPGLPDYDKTLAISLGVVLGAAAFFSKPSFKIELVPPPPRDIATEIAEIWAELLDKDTVERDKSFMELGGSERLARVAVGRMKKIGISLKDARRIYEGASVSDLTRFAPVEGRRVVGDNSIVGITGILVTGLLVAAILTVATNGDELIDGGTVRPSLGLSDVINMTAEPVIAIIPFLFGLWFLKSRSHHMEVFRAIVVMGVIYACLALFEARMSPQLNIWIYGYFQHSWIQHIRGGAFRPIVFLGHGLWVGFFLLTAAVAAVALYRHIKRPGRYLYLGAAIWIFAVLLLSRNLGATMLAFVFVPIALLLPQYIQSRVTLVVAVMFLAYPAIWQAQILPKDEFLAFLLERVPERAYSLQFRLNNEGEMLMRALERPFFGWGAWDRWRVFDANGNDTTVADGIWIITLGERGWIGYFFFFGLVTIPMMYLIRALRRKEPSGVVQAMGLIMAANLIYMIPNATLTPIAWLLVGTIAAYVRWYVVEVDISPAAVEAPREFSPYTRFAHRRYSRGVPVAPAALPDPAPAGSARNRI